MKVKRIIMLLLILFAVFIVLNVYGMIKTLDMLRSSNNIVAKGEKKL